MRVRWAALWVMAMVGCEDANIYDIDDDIEIGLDVKAEIESNPDDFPVIYADDHPDAYEHLYRVRDHILSSGQITYEDEFDWEVYLIDDDELNAFAAPGGYIWVYTGLLGYLDEEDHFAGVLAHEIAHADERHTTEQLTTQLGFELLLGDAADTIVAALVDMSFSRADEAQADEYSVRYLCETDYAADGAAGFFEKLEEEGSFELPEFFSTHPSSDNRTEDIKNLAQELGCSTELSEFADWNSFIESLP